MSVVQQQPRLDTNPDPTAKESLSLPIDDSAISVESDATADVYVADSNGHHGSPAAALDNDAHDGEGERDGVVAPTSIESILGDGEDDEDEDMEEDDKEDEEAEEEEEERQQDGHVSSAEWQLQGVHDALVATVASMRQRQQEQHHLHQLAVSKLEAVAQICVAQQEQLHSLNSLNSLNSVVHHLRDQNREMGEENEKLRRRIAELESEVGRNQIAVHAMSSAVSGLEGWINNSPSEVYRSPSAAHTPRKGRIVVQGRGRFRGRYFVDDPNGEIVLGAADPASDTRELHDGVKSWLKGFRDVEEELHVSSPPRVIRNSQNKETRSEIALTDGDGDDDGDHYNRGPDRDPDPDPDHDNNDQVDWGEFETVSEET